MTQRERSRCGVAEGDDASEKQQREICCRMLQASPEESFAVSCTSSFMDADKSPVGREDTKVCHVWVPHCFQLDG